MKKLLFVNLLFLLGIIFSLNAQNDRTNIEISEDSTNISDYHYKQKYRYLDNNLNDEHRLFKVGIIPSPFEIELAEELSANDFALYFSYEKKIKTAFSLSANSAIGKTRSYHREVSVTSTPPVDIMFITKEYYAKFSIEARYYFNLKRRIQNGIGGNNFQANYISITPIFAIPSYFKESESIRTSTENRFREYDYNEFHINYPRIAIGSQRRFQKYFYMDASVFIHRYFHVAIPYTAWGIDIKLGLALGK